MTCRRAFTLIELVAIIAIIGVMVAASVVGIQRGQRVARLKAATRDVFATIRHARSMALVSRQPSVVTYSTETDDEGSLARVSVVTAKIFSGNEIETAESLSGEKITIGSEPAAEGERKVKGFTVNGEDPVVTEQRGGRSVEDVLFEPVADDVMRGIRLKVLMNDEELALGEVRAKAKVSVYSNTDFILGRLKSYESAEKQSSVDESESERSEADGENQEPVSVVWEVNGRVEPHRVYVYQDGRSPDSGFEIVIDRFGSARISDDKEDAR